MKTLLLILSKYILQYDRHRSRETLAGKNSGGHLKPADIDRRRSTESLPTGQMSYHVCIEIDNIISSSKKVSNVLTCRPLLAI